ncbi:hypothetical protein AC1031_011759 [Aphanomyces cochlioides]|nr:hypothetical protein AC1031_011759 [Aphanomyces cochlioides]
MIEKADLNNPKYNWKCISDEAEVEIFRGKDPYAPEAATLHCATMDLVATLDEVSTFYRTNTTEEAKLFQVVCSKCGPLWNVKAGGIAVKVRACTTCSLLTLPTSGDLAKAADGHGTTLSHAPSEVWQISEDCESVDYDTTLVSFTTDDSSMSHYSDSTTGPSHS